MSDTIEISANGRKRPVDKGTTLSDFIASQGIDPAVVVVEYNGVIVKKEMFTATRLQNNDVLEVLRFVGGG